MYNTGAHTGAPIIPKPPNIIYYPQPDCDLSNATIPASIFAALLVAAGIFILAFPYLFIFWIICEIRMLLNPDLRDKWGINQIKDSTHEKTDRLHSR